jgi:hypothetical protein
MPRPQHTSAGKPLSGIANDDEDFSRDLAVGTQSGVDFITAAVDRYVGRASAPASRQRSFPSRSAVGGAAVPKDSPEDDGDILALIAQTRAPSYDLRITRISTAILASPTER